MKRRASELFILLAVVAFSIAVFRPEPKSKAREPVSWSLPVIYSLPGKVTGKSVYDKPMYLKPNLERDLGQFSKATVRVDGVGLGMSFSEVLEILGEPVEIEGTFPGYFRAKFSNDSEYSTTVLTVGNEVVVEVQGQVALTRSGEQLAKPGDTLFVLRSHLGKNDYKHAVGYGATPLYCWAGPDAVLEVSTSYEQEIYAFYLADPTFYIDRPHLWFSGCGSVEEEFYIPTSES